MYNLDINNRKSIRLKGYDYSQEGLYFVTICTNNKECLFGDVVDGNMVLNDAGIMVEEEIIRTEKIREEIKIPNYIIMPNHIHLIIGFVGTYRNTSTLNENEMMKNNKQGVAPTLKSPSKNLGSVIRAIKATSTAKINKKNGNYGNKIWQRNYYEHIIRNEKSHIKIAEYIVSNPLKWVDDKYFIE